MSSTASSPAPGPRKRAAPAKQRVPKANRSEALPSDSVARLVQGTNSYDAGSPGTPGTRSISGRTKASTINDARDLDNDADSSDVDEADFGVETFVNYQESTAEKTRMKMLLESFDENQMARYEVYRRVGLNKINVKKLANSILGQSLPQNIVLVIAGSSKVFVGDIVERARLVQQRRGDAGNLSPEHLREAYRQYRSENNVVPKAKKRLLR